MAWFSLSSAMFLNLIDPVFFGLDLIGVHRRSSAAEFCIGFLT